MDCLKPQSDPNKPHKFSFPFSSCIHPQTPTSRFTPPPSTTTNNNNKDLNSFLKNSLLTRQKSHKSSNHDDRHNNNNHPRAAKEALLAKLFASISSIKASYAELQAAQCPYDATAVQTADKQVVAELVVLSDLKHKFVTRTLDLPPPHVANLLAEIQEQQSNIKTYEISIKQMESKIRAQDAQISSMAKDLKKIAQGNKSMERRLNSSGSLMLAQGNLSVTDLNHTHFIRSLQMAMKSIRSFVKHLVREMEGKGWDLDLAATAAAGGDNNVRFTNHKNKAFAFESYVCRVLFDGFNHRDFLLNSDSSPSSSSASNHRGGRESFFDEFRRLQCETASQILIENPESEFGRFCRSKYLKLVQPKMECSFFGNLDQRKLIMSSVAFPGSDFFSAFAEAAKMVWLLHSLAFSFEPAVVAFQVKRGCRFSEVYMESVTGLGGDGGGSSGRRSEALMLGYIGGGAEVLSVGFTVVPGFKIGKTVVQSQVYLSGPQGRR